MSNPRLELTNPAIMGEMFHRLQTVDLGWVGKVAGTPLPSDQGSEKHGWLGQVPTMRARKGGLEPSRLRPFAYEIANTKYEATLNVTGDEYRRDKTAQVAIRIGEVSKTSPRHWASLVSSLALAGATGVCYDGQYFFDTDHSEGDSGTQSNKLTLDIGDMAVAVHGTATVPSPAEMQNAILRGIQAIVGFKDDRGELYNEDAKSFLVQVPVSLMAVAATAIGAPMLDSGNANILTTAKNQLGFDISLSANGRLTWTDTFAIYRTDGDVKPFILQEEFLEPIELGFDSEHFTKHDEAMFGLYTSRGAGYGFWQSACQVILSQ